MTKPIPEGYHNLTPYLMFKDSRKAIEFYKLAFGAKEQFLMPGFDGKSVMHAEVLIGDSTIMMSDENPQQACKSAETMGGSPVAFYVYVEDVDSAFDKAMAAGAASRMPVQDMFWGDRIGSVSDPFGYSWTLATRTRDLSPEEIEKGARAAFAQMTKK
jgi:PhnB protein